MPFLQLLFSLFAMSLSAVTFTGSSGAGGSSKKSRVIEDDQPTDDVHYEAGAKTTSDQPVSKGKGNKNDQKEDKDHPHSEPKTPDDTSNTGGNDHPDGQHEGEEPHDSNDHTDSSGEGAEPIGHEHGADDVDLPQTEAEIEAFVAQLRAMEDGHAHIGHEAKATEHMAAMKLVPRDEATHIAIRSGDWNDPANWYKGIVPDDDARVLIPEGVKIEFSGDSGVRLFTVRVDGELSFATDEDSTMIVDTMVITPRGRLEIGTAENPVEPGVNIDIVFANNGPIDTDWDPLLLSRGLISHGETEIHGLEKDSHEKVIDAPMKGDTFITFESIPEGWQVGDTIVIAGTEFVGHTRIDGELTYVPPQDEVRIISKIENGQVHFKEPLLYDHDAPREDLQTSVANYSRSVTFRSEDGADSEIYERGHVMFMHNDDVDVRYAAFTDLGRTDKSEDTFDVNAGLDIEFDSNVKGRYSLHFHRAGLESEDDPAIAIGNAVFGSPGWGFVHHDSNADFINNASYDTFGAGFVAESGNEIGSWIDNIAIYAEGLPSRGIKGGVDLPEFDTGKTGDGFWFQGRMVESIDNVAASVNTGFVYFHRGQLTEDKQLTFDSDLFLLPDALAYNLNTHPDDAPILTFSGNEVFAAKEGLEVVKSNANQGHDIHSVFDGFLAWEVSSGAHFQYTSHYVIKDFDIIGTGEDATLSKSYGIQFGSTTSDMTILNAQIENVDVGIDLFKKISSELHSAEAHEYVVVNASFIDVVNEYDNLVPSLDTIIDSPVTETTPTLKIDGSLHFYEGPKDLGGGILEIHGTKIDSLGSTEFPSGTDNYDLGRADMVALLEEEGYWHASDGKTYMVLDIYFSDRLTGSIYKQPELVEIDENVKLGAEKSLYSDAKFNGNVNISDLKAYVAEGTQSVFAAEDLITDVVDHIHFDPNLLGDGRSWQDQNNWHNEAVPDVGNDVFLGGNNVDFSGYARINDLVIDSGASIEIQHGRLEVGGDLTSAGNGSFIVGDEGEFVTNIFQDTGRITIDVDGGTFANDNFFAAEADMLIRGDGEAVLATDGARYVLTDGSTLSLEGQSAIAGFDGTGSDASVLILSGKSVVEFIADAEGLGKVAEFDSDLVYGNGTSATSGINFGSSNLRIDVSALAGEDAHTFELFKADATHGQFGQIDIGGLGQNRDAEVVVDHTNGSVSLDIGALGTGTGQVSQTVSGARAGQVDDSLWNALTTGHGVYDEVTPLSSEAEEEVDLADI